MTWNWKKNPNKERHCPICGGKPHHTVPLEVPSLIYCWTPPRVPPPGWKQTKNPNLFSQEGPNHTSYPPPISSTPEPELTDSRLRDAVYREILQRLPLSGSHKQEITKRGFDINKLQNIPFGSLVSGPRTGLIEQISFLFPERSLQRIPGLYLNNFNKRTLSGPPGFLIPVQDVKGHIIALQVRRDDTTEDKSRYTWISSKGRPDGVGSGAPAGLVYPPDRSGPWRRVWLTEGYFKALALANKTGDPVVWIAGVSMVRSALEPLSQLDPDEVVVCFDADWRTNHAVHRDLLKTVLTTSQVLGLSPQIATWDLAKGKGIDDALLLGNLEVGELEYLEIDELLLGLAPPPSLPKSKFLRQDETTTKTSVHPTTSSEQQDLPTTNEIRSATEQAVVDAYLSPLGTITLISGSTSSGKSYSTCKNAPPNTLFVDRDYDDSGEQKRRTLEEFGHSPEWLFGRQKPEVHLDPNTPNTKRERSQKAYCSDFTRADIARNAGHNACKGCKHSPQDLFTGERCYGCGYRRHKDQITQNPPLISQAVTEVALNPDNLSRVETIVFDDIPDILHRLANETRLSIEDVALWQSNNPEQTPKEVLSFFQTIRKELSQTSLEGQDASDSLRLAAHNALDVLKTIEETVLPCESAIENNGLPVYPKKMVRELVEALAEGLPVTLDAGGVWFWSANKELLQILQKKRVIVLDATPDLMIWSTLFGKVANFNLVVPDLPKVTPRIIQIPDIIGTPEQISNLAPQIKSLAEREDAFIITRKGNCAEVLNAEGWLGRHERGLNSLQDYSNGILAGNFSLPSEDVSRMAQGIRSLGIRLGTDPPQLHPPPRDKNGRGWVGYDDQSGRLSGLQRCTFIHEDPLADQISQHHHTASVVQTWGRLRKNAILYLIAGAPLVDVPVSLMTLGELGLESDSLRGNPKLDQINQKQKLKYQQRIEEGAKVVTEWIRKQGGGIPSEWKTREILAEGKGRVNPRLAREVLQIVKQREDEKNQLLVGMVPDRSPNSVIYISTLGDRYPTHSDTQLENKLNCRMDRKTGSKNQGNVPTTPKQYWEEEEELLPTAFLKGIEKPL